MSRVVQRSRDGAFYKDFGLKNLFRFRCSKHHDIHPVQALCHGPETRNQKPETRNMAPYKNPHGRIPAAAA